jgi:hypothetical protein
MKVKDLRRLLQEADREMDVLIPMTHVFDGYWKYPCIEESGVAELGVNENLKTTEKSFVLVPCGFFDAEHNPVTELN